MWSESANGVIYQVVCLILQAAEAHNITVGGGSKYNVPSGDFTTNLPNVPATSQNLTSYALAAIAGADNFNDDNVIARDVFDIIVDVTREVTPTCEFPIVRPYLRTPPTHPQIKSEPCGLLGMCKRRSSLGRILTTASSVTVRMDGLSVLLNGYPHSALSNLSTPSSS